MEAIYVLMPAKWRPYAKAVVTALATILVAVSAIAGAPAWVPIAVSFLGSLGVYGVANKPATVAVVVPEEDVEFDNPDSPQFSPETR